MSDKAHFTINRFCERIFGMIQNKNRSAVALGKLAKGRPKNFKPGYIKTLSERLAAAREKRLKKINEKKLLTETV